jgi:group I intron endonuclease
MGYIYGIKNLITNKVCYIGQSVQSDVRKRWSSHLKKDSCCTYLKRTIEKYGKENFEFFIIIICFDEDCDKYEIDYIKKYDTLVPNGANLSSGGSSGFSNLKHTEESKKIMSEKSKKYFDNIENRKKQSKIVKKSLENINISEKVNNSEKWKKALEDGRVGGFKKSIPIIQYDNDLNEIQKFSGINEAARQFKVSPSTIRRVLDINNRRACGFYWKINKEKEEIKINDKNITKKYNINLELRNIMGQSVGTKIAQYDLKGNLIKEFISIREAARNLNCNKSGIDRAINNDKYSCVGFKWKRIDPLITNEEKYENLKIL